MNNLVILTGPTSVGKTGISIKLAKAIDGSVISADSMQVYKGMDIGTAKIKPSEKEGIPHYMIDVFPPEHDFNVAEFAGLAKKYINEIYEDGRIPIIVGGTGFYIQALLYDVDFESAGEDPGYREYLQKIADSKGADYLHALLAKTDPDSAEMIHANNVKRVIRALEFHHLTGKKISEHNRQERGNPSPYNYAYFVLNDIRERIYERIDRRVDQMISDGLVEEVKGFKAQGLTKDNTSMKGLGYKEILSFLEGECTLEDAVYILKRDTRHFAKRQLTWFRRERDVIWVEKNEFDYDDDRILEFIKSVLNNKGFIR